MANKTLNTRQKRVFRVPMVTPLKVRAPLPPARSKALPRSKPASKATER
jgi:hypothetical protein